MTVEEDPLSPLHKQQFVTENIYRCLAPCHDCTGKYISQLLGKRLICNCICHKQKTDNKMGSVLPPYLFSEVDK
jgi:hypothetical protein